MSNKLREIEALGQAVWIDNLNRQLLDEGTLATLIADDGISGVTSNPTIFEKGMGGSDRYDDAFREVLGETSDPQEVFERLALGDVRDAADLLRPTFDETQGQDGYVSFELPAALAFDAQGSIDEAVRLSELIDRENVLIKAPGTEAGVEAFEELTAARCERQHDAAVRRRALPRDRGGLRARPAAAPGRRRAGGPRRLRGELLRVARGHQGGRRAGAARPRGPARQGGRGERQDRVRGVPARSSRERRGSGSRRPGRTCSGRSGPPPRRRTPTTRTRSTWTS